MPNRFFLGQDLLDYAERLNVEGEKQEALDTLLYEIARKCGMYSNSELREALRVKYNKQGNIIYPMLSGPKVARLICLMLGTGLTEGTLEIPPE